VASRPRPAGRCLSGTSEDEPAPAGRPVDSVSWTDYAQPLADRIYLPGVHQEHPVLQSRLLDRRRAETILGPHHDGYLAAPNVRQLCKPMVRRGVVLHGTLGRQSIIAVKVVDDRPELVAGICAHDVAAGNFQILSCGAGPGHRVIMTIAAFFYATSEPVRRVLGFDFSRDGTRMTEARNTVILKENVYAKFREKVVQQLGARASDFIADLQI